MQRFFVRTLAARQGYRLTYLMSNLTEQAFYAGVGVIKPYSYRSNEVITVDKQADSVDFALMGLLTRDDIVVTQDFGLAAMVLGKGALAVNQNGLVYTDDNIDKLLLERHIGAKVRRGGGRTKGPAKRTKEDNERFEAAFDEWRGF